MRRIFYSWQSDLPTKTNRNFIEAALKAAVNELNDSEVEEAERDEAVVDQGTQGMAGSPDIKATILDKISKCDVFVCDVSICFQRDREGAPRYSPNPNVLFELGYAVKSVGWERIILVVNTAYGKVETLPFDIRGHRMTPFALAESENPKEAKKSLTKTLKEAIEAALADAPKTPPPPTSLQKANDGIEKEARNRAALVKTAVKELVTGLRGRWDEEEKAEAKVELVDRLRRCPQHQQLRELLQQIVDHKDSEAAQGLTEGLRWIAQEFQLPRGEYGQQPTERFFFFRECARLWLLLSVASFLEQDELLDVLFQMTIDVDNLPQYDTAGMHYLASLGRNLKVYAILAQEPPLNDLGGNLEEADALLALRLGIGWMPSLVQRSSKVWTDLQGKNFAEAFAKRCGLKDVPQLQVKYTECVTEWRKTSWSWQLLFPADKIGWL